MLWLQPDIWSQVSVPHSFQHLVLQTHFGSIPSPDSRHKRSEHNACKCVTWRGVWQLKEWMKLWRLEVKWQWAAAYCWGSQIQCSTVAPWLMSVVSAPLDTRLLLCSLIQPHAIKQKSHCMQGWSEGTAQPRESPLFSRLLSHLLPGSLECMHCWAGTQAHNTHITESPRGSGA